MSSLLPDSPLNALTAYRHPLLTTTSSPVYQDVEERVPKIRHDSDSNVRTTDTYLLEELAEAPYINDESEQQFRLFRRSLSRKERQEILDECPTSMYPYLPTTSSSGLSESGEENQRRKHDTSCIDERTDSSASDDTFPETCINDETEQEYQACQERYARLRKEQALDDRKQTSAEILKSIEEKIKIWRESYDYVKEAEYIVTMCQQSACGSSQPDDLPPKKKAKGR